jgi:hypothetical protein
MMREALMADGEYAPFTRIQCHNCGTTIHVDDALRRELDAETEVRVRARFSEQGSLLAAREHAIHTREEAAAQAEAAFEARFQTRLKAETTAIEASLRGAARAEADAEIQELRAALTDRERLIQQAHAAELELRKERRDLQQQRDALTLEVTRRIDAERTSIVEDAVRRTQEEFRLKDAEKDRRLQDALRVNDELRRKLEQGSQQSQGEVLEASLEQLLKLQFPFDVIESVGKGVRGADILQRVHTRTGQYAGTIMWEAKNTKNWSDAWLDKLRDDQRDAKADLAVLVSAALPAGITGCGFRESVWLADPRTSLGLATALRNGLIEIAVTKSAVAGKNERVEVIFSYLTSADFRQRIEAIVRTFVDMQTDLDEEKRVSARRWAKREKQIGRMISNTASLCGDLQGMLGRDAPTFAALESGPEPPESVVVVEPVASGPVS